MFEATVGGKSVKIKFAETDDDCQPVPYARNLGAGLSISGTAWVCRPLEDSHVEGELKFFGATILTFELDRDDAEASATAAGIAKFKLRYEFGGSPKKPLFKRCDFNNNIFRPRYNCPDDWVTLLTWGD